MRLFLTLSIILSSLNIGFSQSFYIEEDLSYPDFTVEIDKRLSFEDFKIKIAKNLSFADISVKIIPSKSTADFQFIKKRSADYKVKLGHGNCFPDLKIEAGNNISFPDLKINIKSSGTADYKVYAKDGVISTEELIVTLLPAINKETNGKISKLVKVLK